MISPTILILAVAIWFVLVRLMMYVVARLWIATSALNQKEAPAQWIPLALIVPIVLSSVLVFGALWVPNSVNHMSHAAHHYGWIDGSADLVAPWIHVCLQHLLGIEISLWWPLFAFLFVAAQPLQRLFRVLQTLLRTSSRFQAGSEQAVYGFRVTMLPGVPSGAITTGVLYPRIVVDHDWFPRLTEQQQRCVVVHEAAHVSRHDPRSLLILHLLVSFLPRQLGSQLVGRWRNYAEFQADNHAAAEVGDPLRIADTILAVARCRNEQPLALGHNSGEIETRVLRLINRTQQKNAKLTPDVGSHALVLVLVGVVIAWLANPTLHHSIEHLLNHIR